MIVNTMTSEEIHKEVFLEISHLKTKIQNSVKEFGKITLKQSKFPFSKTFKLKSKLNNIFILQVSVDKRSQWKTPFVDVKCIYTKPEGKYVVAPSIQLQQSTIYPPHFFKRYRERILKDQLITTDDLIEEFFKNYWGFTAAVIDENFKSVYYSFEDFDIDDKISFVAATDQGYCFGERRGNVNILKTIISEEMLFEDQKEIFTSLKNNLRFNKNHLY